MTDRIQLCTFYLADHYFGIPVASVQEILRYQEMTEVPLASKLVAGLINIRGQIVTAIDLRRRLAFPPAPAGHLPTNIVTRGDGGAVSLLVDEIGDVVEVDLSDSEPPPPTLSGPSRSLITRVFKLRDQLLLVLDPKKAVDVTSAPSDPVQAA